MSSQKFRLEISLSQLARPLRIEIEDAIYQVTARANERQRDLRSGRVVGRNQKLLRQCQDV
jgi:uncharacterized protein with PIN domain